MYSATFFSLLAAASAVLVTETDYNTFYVTVGPDGQPQAGPTATSTAAPVQDKPVSLSSVSSFPSTSSSTFAAPVPTTSTPSSSTSSSTSSSSTPSTTSSTYVAPTPSTTSTSSKYTPPTTTSSSTSSVPATTTSSTAAPSSTLNPFQSDIVNYHNRVRSMHHVGPVSWSDELAGFASNYLAHSNCQFAHSGGPYGENIAIGYATTDDALDAWYDEEDQYDYAAGQFGENTGHFTQMVWKGTNQVGCATRDCSGRTYLVCEYKPRGNIIGHFTENVFPI